MSEANYEQAGDLKIGQVGIANLRLRTLDIPRLADEMRERVRRAPAMFGRAAVIIDFGGLAQLPSQTQAEQLLAALRSAGVLPVALAYGSSENDALAVALGLPTLAKFRAQYERNAAEPPAAVATPVPIATSVPVSAPPPATGEPGLVHAAPVRSGQQVYADNRDLTVIGMVGAGAEVMADGSVHVYGALRGRALAGAQGDLQARIFCREFHAELVAIAGHYLVLDEVPPQLIGKPVQAWLENEQVKLQAMA